MLINFVLNIEFNLFNHYIKREYYHMDNSYRCVWYSRAGELGRRGDGGTLHVGLVKVSLGGNK